MPKFWSFLGGLVAAVCVWAIAAHAQGSPSAPDVRDAVNGFESTVPHRFQGVPTDWADRHLVFSEPSPGSRASERVQANPRYWLSKIRSSMQANAVRPVLNTSGAARLQNRGRKSGLNGDWSMSLGTNGTVGAGMYPAKYSFDIGATPSCANDFVVFNTSLAASATQASIAAFSNLYNTTCSPTVPATYWAYNTGGTVRTSVALSTDGTQVAFVQSVGTTANLVLLKWLQSPTSHTVTGTRTNGSATITATGGSIVAADVGARITGTGIPTNTYITAVTSTTATMSANATGNSSNSITVQVETAARPGVPPSVTNAAYRGCTAPCMTQIAFSGNQNDSNSAPFPDYTGDIIYVGADDGTLHKFTGVFSGTPAEVTSSPWPVTVHSATVLSSPVFDASSSNIFVGDVNGRASFVTAGGSMGGTTQQIGATGSVIVDAPLVDSSTGKVLWFASRAQTSNPTLTDYVEQTDTALANPVTLILANNSTTGSLAGRSHAGAFDNLYFNSASNQGFLYFCAVVTGQPNYQGLYRVGFTNTPTTGTLASAVQAGPLTMVNGYTTSQGCSPLTEFVNGTTDRMFVSVTGNGALTGCTGACLYSFAPATRTVTDAVTNGTTTVTSATANFVAGDVGSAVTGTNIPVGATITVRNSATSITISAVATGSGSGGTLNVVAWPSTSSAGMTATGGTSGIIIDNSSSSTGASQVYFSTLTGTTGAVQASQAALR